jgi:hypothetical protein
MRYCRLSSDQGYQAEQEDELLLGHYELVLCDVQLSTFSFHCRPLPFIYISRKLGLHN